MVNEMSSRERMLAALRQEGVDRLPVWLKMANDTWQRSQPEPYRSMAADALLFAAGCDLLLFSQPDVDVEIPRVRTERCFTSEGELIVHHTPDGDISGIVGFDPDTASSHPVKYFVNNAEDLSRLRWLFVDTRYHMSSDALKASALEQEKIKKLDGVSASCIGPGPFMCLLEEYCGLESLTYLQADEPDLFAEVLDLMHQDRIRALKARLPYESIDTFWLIENTSTTLLSPAQFRDYCMPHLKVYGEMILDNGLIPVHHMCGCLNGLLEMIDELPATVNEAFTSAPVGDVSLEEGRRRMPGKALIGGTNAALWLEAPEVIVDEVERDLSRCIDSRGIFLSSAGVLPPAVSFEKARKTVEGLKCLPV